MIINGLIFDDVVTDSKTGFTNKSSVTFFIRWIEKQLGGRFIFSRGHFFSGKPQLSYLYSIAKKLMNAGIIKNVHQFKFSHGVPSLKLWKCEPTDWTNLWPGGCAEDDVSSLSAALAETTERYLWTTKTDYYKNPIIASELAMKNKKRHFIPISSFASYSKEERDSIPRRHLKPSAEFLWIKGQSYTNNNSVYLPAQFASSTTRQKLNEPELIERVTTGLATWPTREGALASGFLEIAERDAYMITWLNQLTMPKIALESLLLRDQQFDDYVKKLLKYRFKIHIVKLCTDVPAHVLAVVLEDLSGQKPKYSFGLKAGTSVTKVVYGAITEALRAHHSNIKFYSEKTWDGSIDKDAIEHTDRVYYWALKSNAEKLDFFVQGTEYEYNFDAVWEGDNKEKYLAHAVEWCQQKKYDFISVSMTHSKFNFTPWHIESVVVPQMTPTYLFEARRMTGSSRIKNVPLACGYTPLQKPYTDQPHPFA